MKDSNSIKNKIWVAVNDMVAKLPDDVDIKNDFDADFGSDYRLRIENIDGQYLVTNGVNGWGHNCKNEFKDVKAIILIQLQSQQPEIDINNCKHEALIDTGTGFYYCSICNGSIHKSVYNKSQAEIPDVDLHELFLSAKNTFAPNLIEEVSDEQWFNEGFYVGRKQASQQPEIATDIELQNYVYKWWHKIHTLKRHVQKKDVVTFVQSLIDYISVTHWQPLPLPPGEKIHTKEDASDAVEFAEWVCDGQYIPLKNEWATILDNQNKFYTTKELYKLFKQSKSLPPIQSKL